MRRQTTTDQPAVGAKVFQIGEKPQQVELFFILGKFDGEGATQ